MLVLVQLWHGVKLVRLTFSVDLSEFSDCGEDVFEIESEESGTHTCGGYLVDCYRPNDTMYIIMLSHQIILSDFNFREPYVIDSLCAGNLRCCHKVHDDNDIRFMMGHETEDRYLLTLHTVPRLIKERS